MHVGAVREDPRGKINRGGEVEHIFSIRAGDFIRIVRSENREKAEAARDKLIRERGL